MKNLMFHEYFDAEVLKSMKEIAETTANTELKQKLFEYRMNNREKYNEQGQLKQEYDQLKIGENQNQKQKY